MINLNLTKKEITTFIILIILLIGLGVSVYLVQTKQIFRSKAAADINSALKLTDDSGQEVPYLGNGTYQTTSNHVNVSIKSLEELINP